MKQKTRLIIYVLTMVFPFMACAQETNDVKPVNTSPSDRLVLMNRYRAALENNNTMMMQRTAIQQQSFRLNVKTPEVRFYNTADFYADGRLSCVPLYSWGPYQVPFHLNQPIVVYKNK